MTFGETRFTNVIPFIESEKQYLVDEWGTLYRKVTPEEICQRMYYWAKRRNDDITAYMLSHGFKVSDAELPDKSK